MRVARIRNPSFSRSMGDWTDLVFPFYLAVSELEAKPSYFGRFFSRADVRAWSAISLACWSIARALREMSASQRFRALRRVRSMESTVAAP